MPPSGATEHENGHPRMMEIIPLSWSSWRGARDGLSRTGRTHPEGYAFCPSPEGIFTEFAA